MHAGVSYRLTHEPIEASPGGEFGNLLGLGWSCVHNADPVILGPADSARLVVHGHGQVKCSRVDRRYRFGLRVLRNRS